MATVGTLVAWFTGKPVASKLVMTVVLVVLGLLLSLVVHYYFVGGG